MDDSFFSLWNNVLHVLTVGLNDWGSLHPAIVHIPIALLLTAPLFILLGLIFSKSSKTFYLSALTLFLIGTFSLYLATSTGEKASDLVESSPDVITTLGAHDALAHRVRRNFTILTSIFLTYILLNFFLTRKLSPRIHQGALIVFLIFCAYNIILLLNTSHLGGKLVHHHKVTSNLFSGVDSNK